MIVIIWYIREIGDLEDDYIYYQFQLPYMPLEKTTLKTANAQEFLWEEPIYNYSEGRNEIYLAEILEADINSYLILGWKRKLVEEPEE